MFILKYCEECNHEFEIEIAGPMVTADGFLPVLSNQDEVVWEVDHLTSNGYPCSQPLIMDTGEVTNAEG